MHAHALAMILSPLSKADYNLDRMTKAGHRRDSTSMKAVRPCMHTLVCHGYYITIAPQKLASPQEHTNKHGPQVEVFRPETEVSCNAQLQCDTKLLSC